MIKRVRADASHVELAAARKAAGCELRACVYFFDARSFIATAISGICEDGPVTVLPADAEDAVLGVCVADHLLKFRVNSPEGMALRKLADWEAYRVSGAGSRSSFETRSYVISLSTVNTAIVADVRPCKTLRENISVQGTASAEHADIGRTIRDALKAAVVLREQGVV